MDQCGKCARFSDFRKEGGTVVGVAANVVALLSVLLHPYMPETSSTIRRQLNLPEDEVFWLKDTFVQLLPPGHRIGQASTDIRFSLYDLSMQFAFCLQVSPLFHKLEQSTMEVFRGRFAGSRSKESTPVAKAQLSKEELERAISEQVSKDA